MMEKCEQCHGIGRIGSPQLSPWPFTRFSGFSATCKKCGGTGRTDDPSAPEPVVVTGSVGFAIERDALKAERDRLARFMEEVWAALHADCGPIDADGIVEEAERKETERLRLTRQSEWFQNLRNHGQANFVLQLLQDGEISLAKAAESLVELAHGTTPELPDNAESVFEYEDIPAEVVVSLRHELEEARAELARMRPVVAAAEQFWLNAHGPNEFIYAQKKLGEALTTYRAGAGKEGE